MSNNTTSRTGTIVAIDLGEYKSVACLYSGDPAAAAFPSLPTGRDHRRRLFARHAPAAAVIGACLLAGWVHDLCHGLGLRCHVANTANEAWEFKHAKRKTGKGDARRLSHRC